MYFQLNINKIKNKLGVSKHYQEYLQNNLFLTKGEIEKLQSLEIHNYSKELLSSIIDWINSQKHVFFGDRNPQGLNIAWGNYIIQEIPLYFKKNSIRFVKMEEKELWKYVLLKMQFFDTSEKLDGLISLLKEDFNQKVDIINFNISGDVLDVPFKSLVLLNKIDNFYEDFQTDTSGDLVLLSSSSQKNDLASFWESDIDEVVIHQQDLIIDEFLNRPIDLKLLMSSSQKILNGTQSNTASKKIYSVLQNNIKVFKSQQMMEIIQNLTAHVNDLAENKAILDKSIKIRAASFDIKDFYPDTGVNPAKMAYIFTQTTKDDLNDSSFIEDLLSLNIEAYKGRSSIQNYIWDSRCDWIDERFKTTPVFDEKQFDKKLLMNDSTLRKLVEFLSVKNAMIDSSSYSLESLLNDNTSAVGMLSKFVKNNKDILQEITSGNKSSIGNIKTELNGPNVDSFISKFFNSLINVFQEDISLIINKYTKNSSATKELLILISACKFSGVLPKISELENLLKEPSIGNMSAQVNLLSLYSDDDIFNNRIAHLKMWEFFKSNQLILEDTHNTKYCLKIFPVMFEKYLNGDVDYKSDVLFFINKEVAKVSKDMNSSYFSTNFVQVLESLDNTMKSKPISFNNDNYNSLRELLDDLMDSDDSRFIIMAHALNGVIGADYMATKARGVDYVKSELFPEKPLSLKANATINEFILSSMEIDSTHDYLRLDAPNVLKLLENDMKYKDLVISSLRGHFSEKMFQEKTISQFSSQIIKQPEICLELLKCFYNHQSMFKIINKKSFESWSYLVNEDNNKKVLNFLSENNGKLLEKIPEDYLTESFTKRLFSVSMSNIKETPFTKQQWKYESVKNAFISKASIKDMVSVYGSSEILKPKNLLLLSKRMDELQESISLWSDLSPQLYTFLSMNNIKSGNVYEYFNIVFNSIALEMAIPKNDNPNKVSKVRKM